MSRVAETTLAHLGGQRFLVMTGGTPIHSGDVLLVTLPRGRSVRVAVNGQDLYDLTLLKLAPRTLRVSRQHVRGVHVEKLCEAFSSLTGLATHL